MNPYDSFGYWHNVILDSIQGYRKASRALSFEGSCAVIRRFYKMKGWGVLAKDQFYNIPQVTALAADNMSQLIALSPWSEQVQYAIERLVERMRVLETDSCSYAALKKEIAAFEDSIVHSNLSTADQEVVLKVASVARHSGYRWMQHKNWRKPYVNDPGAVTARSLLKKVGKWFVVTLCDMGGAVAELSIANAAACSDYMSRILAY